MSISQEIESFFYNMDAKWQRTIRNFDSSKVITACTILGAIISQIMLFSSLGTIRGWQIFISLMYGIFVGAVAGCIISYIVNYLVQILQFLFWAIIIIIAISVFIILLISIVWQK